MTHAQITNEQSQAVAASQGQPVYLVDATGQDSALAIVRVELLQGLVGDQEFDIRETYGAQEQALSSIWSDPQLDEYTDEDGTPID